MRLYESLRVEFYIERGGRVGREGRGEKRDALNVSD
jgi:hypothetical protein